MPLSLQRPTAFRSILRLGLLAGLFLTSGPGLTLAGDDGPPLASFSQVLVQPQVAGLTGAVLHDQMDSPGVDVVSSQDFAINTFDSQAADDFTVPSGVASWEITSIDLGGTYASGATTVTNVAVRFYVDGGNARPGNLVFSQTTVPVAGNATGAFTINLNPPARLAGNGQYWVSVQASLPSGEWLWIERLVQTGSVAVWQNPGNGLFTGCAVWQPVHVCDPGDGPDLRFRLNGNVSASNLAPALFRLDPPGAANRNIVLNAYGANFAAGATLSLTVGSSVTNFPATVLSSGLLTANIPASALTAYKTTGQVAIINPEPCVGGTCVSNQVPFYLGNFLLLPYASR